jgi:anti-sigma-K factor RskA
VSATGSPGCEKRDGASAYLLGSLPAFEAYAFEQHLAGCAQCQRDIRELSAAVDMLGSAVPTVPAPPELGERIRGIVRAEADLLHAAGPEADRPVRAPRARERPRWRLVRPRILVAATLAVGVLCGVAIGSSLLGGTSLHTRAISAEILQPGVSQDASATLNITGESGTLSVKDLPSPPAGRVYEVWRVVGAKKLPTDALFSVNSQGDGTVAVPGSLHGVRQILVTAEPLGGSPVPTRSPIIAASTET